MSRLSSPLPHPLSPVYNVPMALDQSLMHSRGWEPERARVKNKRMVEEAKKYMVGPMPPQEFIDHFLDISLSSTIKPIVPTKRAFQTVPSRAATPAEIYEPLVRIRISHD